MQHAEVYRVAVMASGTGNTFRALVEADRAGRLHARVQLLVVSRAEAEVAAVGAELGVSTVVVDATQIGAEATDARHAQLFAEARIDLVVLAGYLRLIGPRTLASLAGQIINTHPAPLPAFGGPGMFGSRVHEAVLAAGVAHSAATVHLVDAEYDHGAVLAATPVPVEPGDDVASLRARVQSAERKLLIATINRLAADRRDHNV